MDSKDISPSRTYVLLLSERGRPFQRKVWLPEVTTEYDRVIEWENNSQSAMTYYMRKDPGPMGLYAWSIESHTSTDELQTYEEVVEKYTVIFRTEARLRVLKKYCQEYLEVKRIAQIYKQYRDESIIQQIVTLSKLWEQPVDIHVILQLHWRNRQFDIGDEDLDFTQTNGALEAIVDLAKLDERIS
jgi:hypothetical protein